MTAVVPGEVTRLRRRAYELDLHVAELCEAHARHERELGRHAVAAEAERIAREVRERAEAALSEVTAE